MVAFNMYPRNSSSGMGSHLDSFGVFASAVIVLQNSGHRLEIDSIPDITEVSSSDIIWLSPRDSHRVHPAGRRKNRISLVITS